MYNIRSSFKIMENTAGCCFNHKISLLVCQKSEFYNNLKAEWAQQWADDGVSISLMICKLCTLYSCKAEHPV